MPADEASDEWAIPEDELWVGIEWRYLETKRGVRVKHALRSVVYSVTGHVTEAYCGVAPGRSVDWMGTGSQVEYDKVARLPRCKMCVAHLRNHGV